MTGNRNEGIASVYKVLDLRVWGLIDSRLKKNSKESWVWDILGHAVIVPVETDRWLQDGGARMWWGNFFLGGGRGSMSIYLDRGSLTSLPLPPPCMISIIAVDLVCVINLSLLRRIECLFSPGPWVQNTIIRVPWPSPVAEVHRCPKTALDDTKYSR